LNLYVLFAILSVGNVFAILTVLENALNVQGSALLDLFDVSLTAFMELTAASALRCAVDARLNLVIIFGLALFAKE
jgi:hypothetical protein